MTSLASLPRSCRSQGPPSSLQVMVFMVHRLLVRVVVGGPDSVALVDPDEVACGVAERAVPYAVRLVGGFLDDLGTAGLEPGEGALEVVGDEGDHAVGPLGHHLG